MHHDDRSGGEDGQGTRIRHPLHGRFRVQRGYKRKYLKRHPFKF